MRRTIIAASASRLADAWLRERGLQSEGRIGRAYVRLARARDIVEVAVEQLKRDPDVFLHPLDRRMRRVR